LGQQYGFVLIGHCFGGLVIKSLVEEARKRTRLGNVRNAIDRKAKASAEKFLKNLKGVVFYAVPHSGSKKLISYFHPLQSDHDSKEGCQAGWVHAKCPTTSIQDGKVVNDL
jgi:hypothetical protein